MIVLYRNTMFVLDRLSTTRTASAGCVKRLSISCRLHRADQRTSTSGFVAKLFFFFKRSNKHSRFDTRWGGSHSSEGGV